MVGVATKHICVILIPFEITMTDLNMQKQTFPGSFVSIDGKLGS